ncbi:hypothetical protein DFH08DRAFT_823349 [Mycena albidolilacea]|uniref:Uncharacterized protein n=1 Tax=Mycena albidolilacea TaxID=1033008 RepID=A0AAD6Z6R9_9AGAR|nr:hypothetical protein DFH08DRAFT_823349 [Mycena albidolilacea]
MFLLPTLSALCLAVHLAAATAYSVCIPLPSLRWSMWRTKAPEPNSTAATERSPSSPPSPSRPTPRRTTTGSPASTSRSSALPTPPPPRASWSSYLFPATKAFAEIVVVQYTDTNGLLSQRFTATDDDEGNWSAAVNVTT